ncbi:hypothetical protein SPFM10_00175 [Salmonella phage SPFM10]|nr:hypothetical protein SPFM10_00175 [Salmonella phage SPFM10]
MPPCPRVRRSLETAAAKLKLARFICAAVLTDAEELADVDLAAPVDPNPSAEEVQDLLAGIRAGFDEAAEKYADVEPSDAQKILIDGPVPSDLAQLITSNAERIGMLNEMNFYELLTGQPLDDEHINRFEKLFDLGVRHEEGADANTLMARY